MKDNELLARDSLRNKQFRQMQRHADQNGKSVPSVEELERLLPVDMCCPSCKRQMNWLSKDGRSTVISLQHDRNGAHRLICLGCNSRHVAMPEDSFYELPDNHKYCPCCKVVKHVDEFPKSNVGKRWLNTHTYCRKCNTNKKLAWEANNREYKKAKRRAYYHNRKASGNPIPSGPDYKKASV